MLTTAQRIMMDRAQQYDLLTRSGNEITDYVRTLPDQGDGLSNDGSHGVWPAATNLAINSNFKTNTTSFIDVGATTTRETTGLVGADTTRGSTVTANAATAEGTSQLIDGGAGSTQYTFSIWLAGTGTIKLYISDSVAGKQLGAQITLTATPTKYSVTATTGALGITETCGWETDSQQSITVTHGRWMCETGANATPHVLTDGAQATRAAARPQLPSALLFTATQGSIVLRLRRGKTPANFDGFFNWQLDASNRIICDWLSAGTLYRITRRTAAGATTAQVTGAGVIGDFITLAYTWNVDGVGIAINGGAFTNVAGSFIPTLESIALIDLLQAPSVLNEFAGDCFWAAAFASRLSNTAESAYLNSLGNAGPPRFSALPGHPTAIWDGVSGVFQRRR